MLTKLPSVSIIILATLVKLSVHEYRSSHDWTYSGLHGQEHWYLKQPKCSNHYNQRQSPIEIHRKETLYDPMLEEISFNNYAFPVWLENKGHTVSISPDSNVTILIEGAGFRGKIYRLYEMHFHWDATNDWGSEHSVDLKKGAMELHMVTYNNQNYKNITEAMKYPDSLAVIALLFDVSEFDNPYLDPIVIELSNIQYPGNRSTTPVNNFVLSDLLSIKSLAHYYRYEGSLTTPPCSPIVKWSISIHHSYISWDQLEKFRALYWDLKYTNQQPSDHKFTGTAAASTDKLDKSSHGSFSPIYQIFESNWRHLQENNRRTVLTSVSLNIQERKDKEGGHKFHSSSGGSREGSVHEEKRDNSATGISVLTITELVFFLLITSMLSR